MKAVGAVLLVVVVLWLFAGFFLAGWFSTRPPRSPAVAEFMHDVGWVLSGARPTPAPRSSASSGELAGALA